MGVRPWLGSHSALTFANFPGKFTNADILTSLLTLQLFNLKYNRDELSSDLIPRIIGQEPIYVGSQVMMF